MLLRRVAVAFLGFFITASSAVAQSNESPSDEIIDFWKGIDQTDDLAKPPAIPTNDEPDSATKVITDDVADQIDPNATSEIDPIVPNERPPFYFGASAGLALYSGIEGAEYDPGFAVSGIVGLQAYPGWRLELDLTYAQAFFENSDDATSLIGIQGSLLADFKEWRGLTPYAGGGLGIVDIDVGNDEDNIELAGHLDGGLSIPVNDSFDIVPSVRVDYIVLSNLDDQIITQLRAGLRWRP